MTDKTTPTSLPLAGPAQAIGAATEGLFKSLAGLKLPVEQMAQIQADYVRNATEVWNQSLQRWPTAASAAANGPATRRPPTRRRCTC